MARLRFTSPRPLLLARDPKTRNSNIAQFQQLDPGTIFYPSAAAFDNPRKIGLGDTTAAAGAAPPERPGATRNDSGVDMSADGTAAKPTSFNGINHLKLPCNDILKTCDFYCTIFPFKRLHQYDHFTPDHGLFAVMAEHMESKLIVEFRYVPEQAEAQKGWDPITWGVGTRADLQAWEEWWEANDVKRSKIFTGIKGWVAGCEDPDGRVVRLYVDDEEHEWTDHPDKDEYWLGSVKAQPMNPDVLRYLASRRHPADIGK